MNRLAKKRSIIESHIQEVVNHEHQFLYSKDVMDKHLEYGVVNFLNMFKTYQFHYPRQTGKTTAIINLVDAETDLVITRDHGDAKDMLKRVHQRNTKVISEQCIELHKNTNKYSIVWFDDIRIDENLIQKLYSLKMVDEYSLLIGLD